MSVLLDLRDREEDELEALRQRYIEWRIAMGNAIMFCHEERELARWADDGGRA